MKTVETALNSMLCSFLFFTVFSPLVFAAFSLGASCDLATGTPYSESVGGKIVTRVSVTGEALGSGFDTSTRVQINCNTGNATPAPLNPLVSATKSTYTSSTLPYSGYCDFPMVASDTTYIIGATLLPHNVSCNTNGVVEVKIEGTGTTGTTPTTTISATLSPNTATPTPTLAAYPTVRSTTLPATPTLSALPSPAATLSAPSEPDKEVQADEEPALLDIPGAVHQVFKKGWSIIGINAADGKIWDGCSAGNRKFKIYFFDAVNQRFRKSALFGSNPKTYRGLGIAVKTPNACAITIEKPAFLSAQTLKLEKGWNLVSVQTAGDLFTDIFDRSKVRNDCDVLSGPWRYDREVGKYVKEKGLQPGEGYWIKAGNTCTISVSQDAPPALPVD